MKKRRRNNSRYLSVFYNDENIEDVEKRSSDRQTQQLLRHQYGRKRNQDKYSHARKLNQVSIDGNPTGTLSPGEQALSQLRGTMDHLHYQSDNLHMSERLNILDSIIIKIIYLIRLYNEKSSDIFRNEDVAVEGHQIHEIWIYTASCFIQEVYQLLDLISNLLIFIEDSRATLLDSENGYALSKSKWSSINLLIVMLRRQKILSIVTRFRIYIMRTNFFFTKSLCQAFFDKNNGYLNFSQSKRRIVLKELSNEIITYNLDSQMNILMGNIFNQMKFKQSNDIRSLTIRRIVECLANSTQYAFMLSVLQCCSQITMDGIFLLFNDVINLINWVDTIKTKNGYQSSLIEDKKLWKRTECVLLLLIRLNSQRSTSTRYLPHVRDFFSFKMKNTRNVSKSMMKSPKVIDQGAVDEITKHLSFDEIQILRSKTISRNISWKFALFGSDQSKTAKVAVNIEINYSKL